MTVVAISTTIPDGGEYAQAIARAGARSRLLEFDPAALDEQLAGVDAVLLSGGGDVDPQRYGAGPNGSTEIDEGRDAFEFALVRRARESGLPTLCICRGLQVANVAFGGTLFGDLGTTFGETVATRHRQTVGDETERGLIASHVVSVATPSRLADIVGDAPIVTGSRHHQSIATVADDLRIVATTADGIVEAAEARFVSPFWLGVQWHPESTIDLDGGASGRIFAAFVAAATRLRGAR